jgi:hypothetical protein
VRFAPTGFPGCVGVEEDEGDEDPEHPASASVHKERKKTTAVLEQKTSPIIRSPVYRSAAVPAAVVAASRRHLRGQDAPATAGKLPALQKENTF